ncbi:MAG: hypothetical protein ABIK32_01500 [Chloroflexota bacterium]
MQDIAPVIVFVGVLVFLAHLFTAIFSRTREYRFNVKDKKDKTKK